MFFLFSSFKLVGIILAAVLVGVLLAPTDGLFIVLGALTVCAGVTTVFLSPVHGLILTPIGAVLLAIGVLLRRRLDREFFEEAEETARHVARTNDLWIPPER